MPARTAVHYCPDQPQRGHAGTGPEKMLIGVDGLQDEGDKLVVVERGDLVFVFNFHPTNSYQDYRVGCCNPGDYKVGWFVNI